MFRLMMLSNKLALHRSLVTRLTSRSIVSTGCLRSSTSRPTSIEGVTATDINIFELAKDDVEFSQNFLSTLSSLDHFQDGNEPMGKDEGESSPPDDSDGMPSVGVPSSVMGVDGAPIDSIEIDGWNWDGDDPIVQNNSKAIDIGNDEEYKAELALRVPEVRDAQTEYPGIKVKLPVSANEDVGTYRFRRDAADLKELGDDTRLVNYDKK